MQNASFLKTFLSCMGILFVQISTAQTTGSFDRKVNFAGNPNWVLSYYVPPGYTAANKYNLIISLHGLGDTPQNMRDCVRNVIISTGSPLPNSIVVAPFAGDNVSSDGKAGAGDFWYPLSDTAIISKAIEDARSQYNIDPEYIYLNGFSLGGRSALRYGLINYKRFRGLELWTPAVQSIAEANNQAPSYYGTIFTYDYQNAKYIPICMTVGSEDAFAVRVSAAYQQLSDAGAIASLRIIDGMGHAIPSNAEAFSCFNYINTNTENNISNDARVADISTPFDEECSSSFIPVVSIQNKGKNNLTSAILNYQIDNGTVYTYNWTGNLISLEISNVTLPSQTVTVGAHTFKAYTTMPNGTTDALASNDAMTKNFSFITKGAISLAEGFEDAKFPPTGWKFAGPDNAWKWQKKTGGASGGNGQSVSCIRFDNYAPDFKGKRYSIRTPQYDFTVSTNPVLTYDYSYNYTKYNDSLVVYCSTDCGSNWKVLVRKAGSSLNTCATAVENPVFIPKSSEWKKEIINLSSLVGQPRVMFSFEDVSAYGNMIYIDNVNLTGVTGIAEETALNSSISIYPNPANQFTVIGYRLSENSDVKISLYDVLGKEVIQVINKKQGKGEYQETINTEELSPGIYFIKINLSAEQAVINGTLLTQKLIINK